MGGTRRCGWDRRAFLGGAAAMVGLPWFTSLARGDTGLGPPPKRLVFWYVPNGMPMDLFVPTTEGTGYALPPLLQPLAPWRDQLLVLSNVENAAAVATIGGDHARGTGCFLTSTPIGPPGAPVSSGVSADHLAGLAPAAASTPFRSLHLGVGTQPAAGVCDSGYACAYQNTITWSAPGAPVPVRTDPVALFQLLFQGTNPTLSQAEIQRRHRRRQSVLDLVRQETHALAAQLSSEDRVKLDQYLTGLRALERQLEQNQPNHGEEVCDPGAPVQGVTGYPQHVDAMIAVMVKALECDATRVLSFMADVSGSYRSFGFMGVSASHHEVSHWGFGTEDEQAEKRAQWAAICGWHIERFATFVDALASRTEPDGSTLLENTTIFFSSEIGDGHTHDHGDLPVLLVGGGQGSVAVGQHIRFADAEPVANVLLGLLDRFGAGVSALGDSTGIPSAVFP